MGLYIIPVRGTQYRMSFSVNGHDQNRNAFSFFFKHFCVVSVSSDVKLHCYDKLMHTLCHKKTFPQAKERNPEGNKISAVH